MNALLIPGRLNWWTRTGTLPSLEPLATSGDGNCLLHAASLYMWGFHDRELILRTALHRTLTTGLAKEGIKQRWKYHTQLRYDEIGLQFSDEEWDFEWGDVIRIATNQPRQQPTTASLRRKSSLKLSLESLEEIHVFALAHVLKRAVIVISDRTIKNLSGEDLAPIYFRGIYLPFEINPTACHKSPIVLGYDSSHFAPLVAKDDKKTEEQRQRGRFAKVSGRKDTVVPLVTPDGSLLPVQFVYHPKKKLVTEKWAKSEFTPGEFPDEIVRVLESYLDVRWIQLKVDSVTSSVEKSRSIAEDEPDRDNFPIEVPKVRFPAAHIKQEAQPIYQKELIEKYLNHARGRYEEQATLKAKREEEKKRHEENKPVPCVTEGCDMFGKKATNYLCSVCYKAKELRLNELSSSTQSDDKEFFNPSAIASGENPLQAPPLPARAQATPSGYQWPVSDSPQQCEHRSLPKQVASGPSLSKQSAPRPLSMQPQAACPSPSTTHAKTTKKASPSRSPKLTHQVSPSKNTKPQLTEGPQLPPQASQSQPPKLSPKVPPKVPSTASATNTKPPLTVPKGNGGSKDGIAKKLKIFPSSPSNSKKPKVARGYSRDGIQPISLGILGGGGSQVVCKNTGCDFFGNEERKGYCSKCFNEISKTSSQEV